MLKRARMRGKSSMVVDAGVMSPRMINRERTLGMKTVLGVSAVDLY
jgi:hypothetical protein